LLGYRIIAWQLAETKKARLVAGAGKA
jgi:hypothetical protein